ncbi:MAG: hypothetical protein ABI867_11520 [Kofleriaceae bacterium]
MAILACSVAARADGVTMFPISNHGLPRSLRAAPAELTRVLATQFDAEIGNVPIEDAVELLECDLDARTCVAAVARSVGVPKLVFARLERRDDGVVVKVSQYSAAKGLTVRTYALEGTTAEALVTSLDDQLHPERHEPTPEKVLLREPVAQPGVVTTGTWALIIGGGVTVAGGAGFLISSRRLAAQARRAPTVTLGDIDRLRAIEQAGKTRTQLGGALVAIGGVVATIGIVRMVMQKRTTYEQPLVDVVPEQGGASVLFTVGWP